MSRPAAHSDGPKYTPAPARDSLELGSLASSSAHGDQNSESSSLSGPPSSRKLSFDNDDPLTVPPSGGRSHIPGRTYSVSSTFDFAPNIFPLSSTHGYSSVGATPTLNRTANTEGGSLEKHKTLTLLNGLSLVTGLIIGSGIFSSPSQVNKNTGSPGASLIVWGVAGILAWTGATSYAELGAAMPLNGGAQMYLTKIFGDMAGFLYSWSCVCVLKPGSAALIAMIFGDYIIGAVAGGNGSDLHPIFNKIVAIIGLVVVTIINGISTKGATRTADFFMFFKFIALVAVVVLGIFAAMGLSWNGRASQDWKTHNWFDGTNTNLSNLAVAVYAGLWAYDGWDNVNYVAGELVQPSRDLPRVIHSSLPLVIVSYLVANTAYFLALPLDVTSSSKAIATDLGSRVLGGLGSLVISIAVAGSCFGSLNATIFTSSRLFYAGAREGYLPSIFGTLGFNKSKGLQLHRQSDSSRTASILRRFCSDDTLQTLFLTPIPSLLLNFALMTVYIILGTFPTLLTFYGVAGYLFYFLTVLGLLVLRVKEPQLERPYRCWITTPIIFCCVSLFLLSRSVVAAPWTSLSVVPFLIVGVILYYWRVKKTPSGKEVDSQEKWWQFWKRWGRR